MMKGTAYLIQATLISLWWIGLLVNQSFYDAFQFPGIGNTAFNAFFLPDLVIVAFLSIVRAYKKIRELDYVILGGFAFATLYCVNATILTNGGFLATTAMTLGLCYNLFLINENRIFRNSNTKSITLNAIKTVLQVICVWIITLFVLPLLIVKSFGEVSTTSHSLSGSGMILFGLFSLLGIYSAFVMVKNGAGTPLPLDQTQNLVTEGPYRFVRNPMAVAGIGQGISISIIFESVPVFVYALVGALLWHLVVRPLEERDMIKRFGEAYLAYRKRVRCWIPKF